MTYRAIVGEMLSGGLHGLAVGMVWGGGIRQEGPEDSALKLATRSAGALTGLPRQHQTPRL